MISGLPKVTAVGCDEFFSDPRPAASTPLVGQPAGTMRLRVGDYRVIYVIEDDEIRVVVVRVAHRRQPDRRARSHRINGRTSWASMG